ncbi:hypothetical protein MMC25_004715 [Agyrium rufum]|nr:hypothetical protein [Agyrium rufum]
MVSANQAPSNILVGTLSITCIAVLYCALTFILYLDNILPFLLSMGMDSLLLIAIVVVAVIIGKPLSYTNCLIIGSSGNQKSAYEFTTSLGTDLNKSGGQLTFSDWAGATRTNCLEMKAIWGLSISLCVLFAFSAICSICLWRRKAVGAAKSADA